MWNRNAYFAHTSQYFDFHWMKWIFIYSADVLMTHFIRKILSHIGTNQYDANKSNWMYFSVKKSDFIMIELCTHSKEKVTTNLFFHPEIILHIVASAIACSCLQSQIIINHICMIALACCYHAFWCTSFLLGMLFSKSFICLLLSVALVKWCQFSLQ